jgi:hypothetical protein
VGSAGNGSGNAGEVEDSSGKARGEEEAETTDREKATSSLV